MRIGAKTVLGQECTISAFQHVSVGRECILADRVMLIDFDHGVVDVELPIRLQGIYKRDVRVGHNVWVGYGACFLRGVPSATTRSSAPTRVVTQRRAGERGRRRRPGARAADARRRRGRCAGSSRAPVRNTGGPTRNGALQMRLDGIHHITAITGDAPRNVDFYTRVLGLRLVKKTVNQDDPSIYHLFYADEHGDPGSDLTFFEYPGAQPGARATGWSTGSSGASARDAALDFWAERLARRGRRGARARTARCASPTPRASTTSCVVDGPATRRWPPSIPRSRPSSRCRASTPSAPTRASPSAAARCSRSARAPSAGGRRWEVRGERRGGSIGFDAPPAERGVQGGGSVHHVAWACTIDEQPALARAARARAGARDAGRSTASTSSRSTSASRAACSSRSRRWARASPSTRTPRELGERLSLPPRVRAPARAGRAAADADLPDPRARLARARR